MQTFLPEPDIKDRQEVQTKKKVEFHYIGYQRRIPGHILFEYNLRTKTLRQAPIKREIEISINLQPVYRNKIVQEKDCVYVQALNEKNAIKRLKRNGII